MDYLFMLENCLNLWIDRKNYNDVVDISNFPVKNNSLFAYFQALHPLLDHSQGYKQWTVFYNFLISTGNLVDSS